jgi:hypothetical protein
MPGSVGQYTQGWLPWQGEKSITGTHARTTTTGSYGMGYYQDSSAAQNDQISWDVYLDVGIWTLTLVHVKDVSYGIATINFNGVSQGTIDMYAASQSLNNFSQLTGLVVSVAGVYTIQIIKATKNGSSTNYGSGYHGLSLIRTGGSPSNPGGLDTPGYTWQLLPWLGQKTLVGSFVNVQNSAYLGGGRFTSNSAAQNDSAAWDVWLDAGTYKFAILHWTFTDGGIFSIQLDGVQQGTIDAYSAGSTFNIYSEVTGIVVSAVYTPRSFMLKMTSKNASSTGYWMRLQSMSWVRTGA